MEVYEIEIIEEICIVETYLEEWSYLYSEDEGTYLLSQWENGFGCKATRHTCQRLEKGNEEITKHLLPPLPECNSLIKIEPIIEQNCKNCKIIQKPVLNMNTNELAANITEENFTNEVIKPIIGEQYDFSQKWMDSQLENLSITIPKHDSLLNAMIDAIDELEMICSELEESQCNLMANCVQNEEDVFDDDDRYDDDETTLEETIEQLLTIGGTVNKSFGKTNFFEENYSTLVHIPKEGIKRNLKIYNFSNELDQSNSHLMKEKQNIIYSNCNDASPKNSTKESFQHNFSPILRRKYVTIEPCFRSCLTTRFLTGTNHISSTCEKTNSALQSNSRKLLPKDEDIYLTGNNLKETGNHCISSVQNKNVNNTSEFNSIYCLPKDDKLSLTGNSLKETGNRYISSIQNKNVNDTAEFNSIYCLPKDGELSLTGNNLKKTGHHVDSSLCLKENGMAEAKYNKCLPADDEEAELFSFHPHSLSPNQNNNNINVKSSKTQVISIQMTSSGEVPVDAEILNYLSFQPFKLKS